MPRGARGGDEDMGEILADAVARGERLLGRGLDRGRLGVEAQVVVEPAGEAVQPVDRGAAAGREPVGERGDRRAGRGQRRSARRKTSRRQIVRQALDDAGPVLGQHPPGDRDGEALDRAVDVEHVGDVAIAVAALAQLGVAIDVDPPVEHRLAGEARPA